jgi:hypothetical protein
MKLSGADRDRCQRMIHGRAVLAVKESELLRAMRRFIG